MNEEAYSGGVGVDADRTITFESLGSISCRTSFMNEMISNIYDQTDMHRGYIAQGMDDGPSPELIERSLKRMALRSTIPALDSNGDAIERKMYVAVAKDTYLEGYGLTPGTSFFLDDYILYVYVDDGLDMVPGSHDVFELISDLGDLFLRMAERSLRDIRYFDPSTEQILFLGWACSDDELCPEEVCVDLDLIVGSLSDRGSNVQDRIKNQESQINRSPRSPAGRPP